MTYEESGQLMTNTEFRARIKVAVLRYADQVIRKTDNTLSLLRWAQQTFASPDQSAMQIQPPLVMHPAVQEYGAKIEDSNLQFAVEQTVPRLV